MVLSKVFSGIISTKKRPMLIAYPEIFTINTKHRSTEISKHVFNKWVKRSFTKPFDST
jgi:hypothetical protein